MKKLSAFFLCIILCLFCLVGCGKQTDKYGFYSQKKLNRCLIPDLPKIQTGSMGANATFYFKTTEKEFYEYLESVYDSLSNCSFEYFGYPTEVLSTFFGGAPKCAFAYGTELNDFQTLIAFSIQGSSIYEEAKTGKHYFFVWGNNGLHETESGLYSKQIQGAKYLQIGFYPYEEYVNAYMQLPYTLMDYTFFLSAD